MCDMADCLLDVFADNALYCAMRGYGHPEGRSAHKLATTALRGLADSDLSEAQLGLGEIALVAARMGDGEELDRLLRLMGA